MTSKTYYVGEKSGSYGLVRRQDDLAGPWVNINIPASKSLSLYDVETSPINASKVFVVGDPSITEGKYGIYVSSDAGVTWNIPSGNYSVGLLNADTWIEVCVIDQQNIVVCGSKGRVAKSTDGGLTFNLCTPLPQQPGNPISNPTVLANLPVYSIHFISPTVGVVGTKNYVYATNDGGTTWMLLNGTNFTNSYLFNVNTNSLAEQIYGIHLSSNALVINVVSANGIFYSDNGGTTFSLKYDFAQASGVHLTWINDNELWAFGKYGQRLKSTNGGNSWFTLSAFNLSGPTHGAGHMYNQNDGFYGYGDAFTNTLQRTSDSCLTGSTTDTSLAFISAVWTTLQEEGCTACPDGFTRLEDGTCQKVTVENATASENLYSVCSTNSNVNFGSFGTKVLTDITSYAWPVKTSGSSVVDSAFPNVTVPVTQTIPATSTIWGNDITRGRLNYSGVWTCPLGNTQPENEWIGFSACLNIQETKTYYIGIAGDNYVRFRINGVTAFEAGVFASPVNLNFNYWYILPITLNAGNNTVYLEGYNAGGPAALGCEIYDFPLAVATNLASITSQGQLDIYTVFSSANQVGLNFTVGQTSGYSCSPGLLLNLCDGTPECIGTITTDPISCNWQLVPCCEKFDPIVVDSALFSNEDEGRTACIDSINGREGCYTIVKTFHDVDYTDAFTVNSITDTCAECISAGCRDCKTCYELEDCSDENNVVTVTNDFSEYVGQIVVLEHCPDKCWIVNEAPKISNCCWEVRMNPLFAIYTVRIVINGTIYTSSPNLTGAQVLSYLNSLGLGAFTYVIPGNNGAGWVRYCVYGTESYASISILATGGTFILYEPVCTFSYCVDGQETSAVVNSFATCESCLPPPVQPEPVKLFQRQVAPGYTTKVCTPEYVEKVNCKYSEQVYNVMKSVRYGIDTCCDDELQKWSIKKAWLNLQEMSDPNPPKPDCYCYVITQNSGTNDFKYIDCSGNCQIVTVANSELYVCAMYPPKVICPTDNTDFTIEKKNICSSDADCGPPPPQPCYCYRLDGQAYTYSYLNCDGVRVFDTTTNVIFICAQKDSIKILIGDPIITTDEVPCANDEACQPIVCFCYEITADGINSTFTWLNCLGEEQGNSFKSGTQYICAREDSVTTDTGTIVNTLNFCAVDNQCQPPPCDCYKIEIVGSGVTTMLYADCGENPTTHAFLNSQTVYKCVQGAAPVKQAGNSTVTVTLLGSNCLTEADCIPPPPCNCYSVDVTGDNVTVAYTDCDNSPTSDFFAPGYYLICTPDENSIVVTGQGVAVVTPQDTICDDCNVECDCYAFTINGLSLILITYSECTTGLYYTVGFSPGQLQTLCSRTVPYSVTPGVSINPTVIATCTDGCIPPTGCVNYYVTNNSTGSSITISYTDCLGSPSTQVLLVGQSTNICSTTYPSSSSISETTIQYAGMCP